MPYGSAPKRPTQTALSVVSILLVDDDGAFRERLARSLRRHGHAVTTADGAKKALDAAARASFEWAIVDLRMPDCSGLELTVGLKQVIPDLRVLVLTGYGSIASVVEAMRQGADNYLSKPADADDVIAALTVSAARPTPVASRPVNLARLEWEHVQQVLADMGGNKSAAARRLGITRRTLQLKLKRDPPVR